MAEFPDFIIIKNKFTSKGGGSCRSTMRAYTCSTLTTCSVVHSRRVALCVYLFGRSIAIMPYYKLVARTSGPVKCNALSNGFTRDVLSLIVHRRGTLGIIFAVLLVTGGSEQVALASA